MYTLVPDVEKAISFRSENLSNAIPNEIKKKILRKLEKIIRDSPYGRSFTTLGDQLEEAKAKNNGKVPEFQVNFFYDYNIGSIFLDCLSDGSRYENRFTKKYTGCYGC